MEYQWICIVLEQKQSECIIAEILVLILNRGEHKSSFDKRVAP